MHVEIQELFHCKRCEYLQGDNNTCPFVFQGQMLVVPMLVRVLLRVRPSLKQAPLLKSFLLPRPFRLNNNHQEKQRMISSLFIVDKVVYRKLCTFEIKTEALTGQQPKYSIPLVDRFIQWRSRHLVQRNVLSWFQAENVSISCRYDRNLNPT